MRLAETLDIPIGEMMGLVDTVVHPFALMLVTEMRKQGMDGVKAGKLVGLALYDCAESALEAAQQTEDESNNQP
jgi:hypothetical protein